MALTKQRKDELARRLAAGEIPEDRDVRALLEHFLSLSGYTLTEVADKIHKSHTAVCLFRKGRYGDNVPGAASNTAEIRVAIKDFIEPLMQEYESAGFVSAGNVYRTGNYLILRKAFFNALDRGWAYCVDGPPGVRKTYPLRSLVNELRQLDASKNGHARRVAYVRCRIGIKPLGILQRIAREFGVPAQGNIDQLLRKIQFHLMGRRASIILDEGQLLGINALETVRELLDMPPYIGLIFAGSHDLQLRFKDLSLEQFRSRIQKTIELRDGVTEDEAIEMITGELGKFPKAELQAQIRKFRVQDPRRDHGRTCNCDQCHYISARSLFSWIEQVRVGMAAREQGGAA
jgi:DNA transposition AAA+ family ATPase